MIPNNPIADERNSQRAKRVSGGNPQPFWFPAPGFYVLSTIIALIIFFLTWWIFNDSDDEMPWISAGLFAGLILGGAVVLREVIFRTRRNNLLLAQQRLDYNLKKISRRQQSFADENKLTLEKNSAIINQITQKSDAAKVLGKVSEAHWEVFELCDEYLHRSEKELETVRVGSPRLAAISRGRKKIGDLHKFHLLSWTAAESRTLIQEAKGSATISGKLEIASRALSILDSAIEFYPDERQLIESSNVVREFITSVRVSHFVEQAEKSAFKGNHKRALNLYRDALFYLARENIRSEERDLIAEKINQEIEKLKTHD